MTSIKKTLLSLLTITAVFLGLSLRAQAKETPTELPGLSIGETIPEFNLKNAAGESVSSQSLLAEDKTLAVVFFRSAGWCSFCKKHLSELNARLDDLGAAGVKVVGISYDSVDTISSFSEKSGIQFPLLSDKNSKVIDGFKVRNKGATKGKAVGVPHPVLFLVDSKGVVAAKLGYEGYKKRPPADEIIAAVKDL